MTLKPLHATPKQARKGLPWFGLTMGLICCEIGCGGYSASPRARRPSTAERPNVLFLAVDDLNDWVGFLGGHPDTRTPNMDRLAARGVYFTNAQCSAPLCNPSRASLLTGTRPSTTGMYRNYQKWRQVLPDAVTLPGFFKRHGYYVAGCGKIFHSHQDDDASWHDYFQPGTDTATRGPKPPDKPQSVSPYDFAWGPLDVPDAAMYDVQTAEWAVGVLQKRHAKPFFLGVGIFRPHMPWYVPRRYFRDFPEDRITMPLIKEDDAEDLPPIARSWTGYPEHPLHRRILAHNEERRAVAAYLASIHFADACVGRVLDALARSPYAENTIIVLWSDHGYHVGEKKHWNKFTLWEESARVPMIMVVPHLTPRGQASKRPVNLVDIYPTLVELCGLPENHALEGVSLVPLLKDPDHPWDRPSLTTFGANNHTVRSERWRYIRYADGGEELYDHEEDPNEWRNLAGDPRYQGVLQDLAGWLPTINAKDTPRPANLKRRHAVTDDHPE